MRQGGRNQKSGIPTKRQRTQSCIFWPIEKWVRLLLVIWRPMFCLDFYSQFGGVFPSNTTSVQSIWHNPPSKGKICDSSGFSVHGILTSTSMVSHHRVNKQACCKRITSYWLPHCCPRVRHAVTMYCSRWTYLSATDDGMFSSTHFRSSSCNIQYCHVKYPFQHII